MHFQLLKYIKQKEELIKEAFMLNFQNVIKTWRNEKENYIPSDRKEFNIEYYSEFYYQNLNDKCVKLSY